MMCIPISLNHESKLISDCYPKSKLLPSLAPDFKPNSQELSRLTYTASNKPGRLNKLGEELEKRAKKESAKAGYNLRSRASFLLTLYILKSLCTECRRDLALFSSSVIKCVDYALDVKVTGEAGKQSEGRDLEILARAGTVFSAFTTYTDGSQIDDSVTSLYLRVLNKFADLATSVSPSSSGDAETRTRARLIGLAAISSAATSDALYASGQYKEQISIIVPALLACFYQTDVPSLEEQCQGGLESTARQSDTSPYFTDSLPNRPPLEKRRAKSIHAHVDGEKGPSNSEVSIAAVRTFRALCGMASGVQVRILVSEPVVDFLDALERKGTSWSDMESWCSWMGSSICAWTQLQYRYVVLTTLVETLVDTSDSSKSKSKPLTLVKMITTLLNSKMTLIGVATSETQASLIGLILRRVKIDPRDPILPVLVESIGALGGKHLYYADQVGDQVEELAGRIGAVLASIGSAGEAEESDPRQAAARNETLRALLACLGAILNVAGDRTGASSGASIVGTGASGAAAAAGDFLPPPSIRSATGPSTPSGERKVPKLESSSAVRNRVTPEALQETIPLLFSTDYSLRASYAAVLTYFISQEIEATPLGAPTSSNKSDSEPSRPGLAPLSNNLPSGVDAPLMRFLNALNAAIFVLLLSPHLGQRSHRYQSTNNSSPSSPPSEAGGDASGSSALRNSASKPHLLSHNQSTPPRSTMLALLPSLHPHPVASSPATAKASATLSDFSNVQVVLAAALRRLPIAAILATVPMLLAFENELYGEAALSAERIAASEELINSFWTTIGETWIDGWATDPENIHASTSTTVIPPSSLPPIELLSSSSTSPTPFPEATTSETLQSPKTDRSNLIAALASSRRLQEGSWLDKESLHKRLTKGWTVEGALFESVERFSTFDVRPEPGGESSLFKISNALMHIDNASLQSFARGGDRPNGKTVGVGELREALGAGRSSLNLNRSPSISTAGTQHQSLRRTTFITDPITPAVKTTTSTGTGRRTLKSGEVSDVFRKLGIGKEGRLASGNGGAGGSTRKSRFAVPALPSQSQSTTPTGVELGATVA
ncbi:hypothetical protein BDY24DRAFT_394206 [Mrakia frigida]|uniref:Efr3p n=1 Tax=Mrakia frigida TaxID=29902 RepID=UPI003FCBF2E9